MDIKIGFIGAGNMAEAMIKGLTANAEGVEIRATNRSNQERLIGLKEKYGIIPADFTQVVELSDLLIIAVKPKDVKAILLKLQEYPQIEGKLVVSLAAGIPMALIEQCLPKTAAVRAMPNTSGAVLYAVTGLVKGNLISEKQVVWVEAVFQAMGKVAWIEEKQMNALIALSGSGPAYYYYFTEGLIKAGIALGLDQETAEMLARETLVGAGKMLTESGQSSEELRQAVTSPNGTTFAALEVFRQAELGEIISRAAQACADRAEEMEREYGV